MKLIGASFYHGVSENVIRVVIAHSTCALLVCRCVLASLGAFINATAGPRHPRQVHTSSIHRMNRSIHVHEDSQHLTYLRVNRTLRFFFVNVVLEAASSRASSAASTSSRLGASAHSASLSLSKSILVCFAFAFWRVERTTMLQPLSMHALHIGRTKE